MSTQIISNAALRMSDSRRRGLKDMQARIRMDLLYRLRWNLLANLNNIEIAVGPKDEEKIIPLFDHSSVDANVSVPGLSRLEVNSDDIWATHEAWHHGDDDREPCACQPPPALVIENEDGRPITLRQFVTEVHGYLNEHMSRVQRAMTWFYKDGPEETILLFQRVSARGTSDADVEVFVRLMLRRDQEYMVEHWAMQLQQARNWEHTRFSAICGATSGRDA